MGSSRRFSDIPVISVKKTEKRNTSEVFQFYWQISSVSFVVPIQAGGFVTFKRK